MRNGSSLTPASRLMVSSASRAEASSMSAGHNGLAQLVAELEGLGGGAMTRTSRGSGSSRCRRTRIAAACCNTSILELDGGQVVAVIEPGGDSETMHEIGGASNE